MTSDPPLQHAELETGRIAFTDEGPREAPTVLAVHGVPGSVRDFRYLGPCLSADIRLVRLDLPGFGGSSRPADGRVSFADRARPVLALADRLGLEHFAVLGHSMGGGTAITVAAQCPPRVTLLVLVASIGLRPHRGLTHPPWMFRALARGLGVPLLRSALAANARGAYARLGLPAEGLGAAELSHQFRTLGATNFAAMRSAAARARSPAIVAWAEDDPFIEPEISRELADAIPETRALRFADAGHHLQKTRAAELAAAIREALVVR